jgi:hypothetical protein
MIIGDQNLQTAPVAAREGMILLLKIVAIENCVAGARVAVQAQP